MSYRREDEPGYNPYPEGAYGRGGDGSPRGGHHHQHHHFGHHEPEGGPYGSSLGHRPPPPPPSRGPGYGDSPPPGSYGEGPYAHRPSGPYEQQPYDERRNPSSHQYPPGPYGAPAYPPGPNAPGHGYGDETYQTSPYAPAPNTHHRSTAEEAPFRRQIPGLPVRIHCKENPDFSLAIAPGQGPVMKLTNSNDDYQVWYKDETMSTRVKDETGASSFSLVNKATGQALRHPPEDLEQCLLAEYEPNGRDQSVWWSMSEDMGHGYRCVRLATKITRNLDVLRGDKKSGGVKDGSPVITFAWKKQDNQIWKMTPA